MSKDKARSPNLETPSRKRPRQHSPLLAATLGAVSIFSEPTIVSAQSHHHHSRREHVVHGDRREQPHRHGDLRTEARRVRWTGEDEEGFQFLASIISRESLRESGITQMPAHEMDENVQLLRRRILYLIQQGQSQRESPGLLTVDTTNHDNEDGTARADNLIDGSLAHQDAQSFTFFFELTTR